MASGDAAPDLRIAIDCSHHLVPGGIRTHIENLVPALAAAAPANEYLLYYRARSRPASSIPLPAGARARTVRTRVPHRLLALLENRLGWPPIECWTGKIDVFHGIHFALPVARAARLVLTVHDVGYLRHPEFYAAKRSNDYGYRYLLGQALRRADRIIAISRSTKRDLVELCNVDPDRIWTILSGLAAGFGRVPAEARAEVLRSLGIDRPYTIYTVGTMDLRKNLDRTLRAFAAAFPRPGERPLLVLTGVGGLPPALRELAATLGLDADVRALQVRSSGELAALLSGARWGMYLSLYEGFGQPPLEAMACGLPLLAADVSSIPEVVGDAALRVDPYDVGAMAAAMRALETGDALRNDLAARGIARATSPAFSWARTARQVLAAYRDDRRAYEDEPQPAAQ